MTGRQTGAAQLSPPKERAHTAGGWALVILTVERAAADSHRIPNESNRYRLLIHLSAFIIAARPPACQDGGGRISQFSLLSQP